MEIRVNATRMELLKLGQKYALAKRGHKLLKDKLDGLIQDFIKTGKNLRLLYDELREELVVAFADGALATAAIDRQAFQAALLYPTMEAKIKEGIVNLMGVKTPRFEIEAIGEAECFGKMMFTEDFIASLEKFKELLPKMIKLAEMFKTIQKVGREITEIKRRVNALEYVMIPALEEKIRYIKMKLAEIERSTTVGLLKIKEMVQR